MTGLTDLEQLLAGWRAYIANHPVASGQFSRDAGYLAGLGIAADQLADTIAHIKTDEEATS